MSDEGKEITLELGPRYEFPGYGEYSPKFTYYEFLTDAKSPELTEMIRKLPERDDGVMFGLLLVRDKAYKVLFTDEILGHDRLMATKQASGWNYVVKFQYINDPKLHIDSLKVNSEDGSENEVLTLLKFCANNWPQEFTHTKVEATNAKGRKIARGQMGAVKRFLEQSESVVAVK